MSKIYYTWDQFDDEIKRLAELIQAADCDLKSIYGIPKGGAPVAVALSRLLDLPLVSQPDQCTLIVDDLVDSGVTMARFESNWTATLHCKPHSPRPDFVVETVDGWVVYPWEETEQSSIQDNITRIIEFIGEDPTREGLLKTPSRVIKSWEKIFEGYKMDPAAIFTTFEPDGYNQLVLLKGIEFFSTCEHHMLNFSGKAHIGYIAQDRIVGISKLARLLDIYARRLQVQERIGQQVTSDLMKYLKPAGAACIIEAEHLCMRCRGVQKQNSVMVTSSLTGRFLEDSDAGRAARAELMTLIK
jgi:GTP cyclohydrolase IA